MTEATGPEEQQAANGTAEAGDRRSPECGQPAEQALRARLRRRIAAAPSPGSGAASPSSRAPASCSSPR